MVLTEPDLHPALSIPPVAPISAAVPKSADEGFQTSILEASLRAAPCSLFWVFFVTVWKGLLRPASLCSASDFGTYGIYGSWLADPMLTSLARRMP